MKDLIKNKINHLQTLLDCVNVYVNIDIYIDGRTYNSLNLNTGELLYNEIRTLSCGCCSDYETDFCNINDLSEQTQNEILLSIDTNQLITK